MNLASLCARLLTKMSWSEELGTLNFQLLIRTTAVFPKEEARALCAWRDLYNLNSVKRYFWGKKKKPPFNLRVTETWIGCVNHDLKVKSQLNPVSSFFKWLMVPCHHGTPLTVTGMNISSLEVKVPTNIRYLANMHLPFKNISFWGTGFYLVGKKYGQAFSNSAPPRQTLQK